MEKYIESLKKIEKTAEDMLDDSTLRIDQEVAERINRITTETSYALARLREEERSAPEGHKVTERYITVRLRVVHEESEDVDMVLSDMDYAFESRSVGARIAETEIVNNG